ncbi:aldehyde ferredoxin oxidoreductase family protein [Natranaerofaba carboxydovora]|uniref:aldehyde ferredoxin oxidoreductase family protein n=1 Tax=Natranaerofaba carboxydovora TaxID=2742683 RepID=UPI001F145A92|nr:aldehyde ferredoxin oxidoreductase C-terminal domain-containing protein [Natranaerofaba carboxydovora]UMZ72681.1 putative oxidoreductase YdhV [Natranaerofaba carboxydovora]
MVKILRVNLTDKSIKDEALGQKYEKMGGRGLTSNIIADEVDPTCHPLGPNNKLVFAPGIVTGTKAPSSGRLSVGGKSPLTGGIKESNAGTPFSQALARSGYKALIIEGQAGDDSLCYLEITKDGVELKDASEYKSKSTTETVNMLREKYTNHDISLVGSAGEEKMASAGICFNDPEYRASRYSGRGGLGAVMGSKGLKAIVLERQIGKVEIKDEDRFKVGQKKLVEALRNHDVTKPGGTLNSYGTASLINVLNQAGGLPVRNFSEGTFEGAEKVSGEAIAEEIKKRGGKGMTGHSCHPGCIIQCSNVWPKEDGSEHTSCIEYESDWSLGPNLGIDNLDDIAEMIDICNKVGIDTIEAGVTLGVAMEAGLAEFGDSKAAINLLKEIEQNTPVGRILGNGAHFTGQAYGVTRIPTVKKQGMPAYEPRAVKGIGITYSTTTMGADHTAGYTVAPEILSVGGEVDPLSPEDKAELSRAFQATTAFVDSSGYCTFITFATSDDESGLEGMIDTVNGVLNTDYTPEEAVKEGEKILRVEKEFNEKAGLNKYDDRPPEFMRYEKLPPHNHTFDVTDEELDKVWDF